MKKTQLFTQQEIADRAGISKSTVYRIIKSSHLKPSDKKGKAWLYSESVLNAVMKATQDKNNSRESVKNRRAESNTDDQRLIAQLRDDLQHEREQNANLVKLLDQSHRLQASLQQQIARLEAPQDTTAANESVSDKKDDESTINTEKATKRPEKLKWWQRLF